MGKALRWKRLIGRPTIGEVWKIPFHEFCLSWWCFLHESLHVGQVQQPYSQGHWIFYEDRWELNILFSAGLVKSLRCFVFLRQSLRWQRCGISKGNKSTAILILHLTLIESMQINTHPPCIVMSDLIRHWILWSCLMHIFSDTVIGQIKAPKFTWGLFRTYWMILA